MTSGNSSARRIRRTSPAIDAGRRADVERLWNRCRATARKVPPAPSPARPTRSTPADHDPGLQYSPNISCAANDIPMNPSTFDPAPARLQLRSSDTSGRHAQFPTNGQACPAFFRPNTGTDMINMSDNWSAHVVPTLLAQPNVTVLITWARAWKVRASTSPAAGGRRRHAGLDRRHALRPLQPRGRPYKYFGLAWPPAWADGDASANPGLGGVPSNPSNNTQPSFASRIRSVDLVPVQDRQRTLRRLTARTKPRC